jgi:multiple sugar transport system permease protein
LGPRSGVAGAGAFFFPRGALRRVLGRDWPAAWLFLLPTAALLAGLIGYPILYALYLSVHLAIGPRVGAFVGLQNYVDVWQDAYFRESIWISVRFTAFSILAKFWLGLLGAILLHGRIRFRGPLTAIALLAWVVPEVVAAFAWRTLYDPQWGVLNTTLGALGVIDRPIGWLADPALALPAAIVANVWKGLPSLTIFLLAGLKSIDRDLYDAAAVDGANAWRRFLHVTLPGLRYMIVVSTLLSTIGTFNGFGLIRLLTNGGPSGSTRVFAIMVYETLGQMRYSTAVASALAMAPFLILLIFVLGRYMLAGAAAGDGAGLADRAAALVTTPFALAFRVIAWVFLAVTDVVERIVGATLGAASGRLSRRSPIRRAADWAGHRASDVALAALLGFQVVPLYFVVITAFKTTAQITARRSIFFPETFTLENFRFILFERSFGTWMLNTVLVSVVAVGIAILAASLGAYALARMRWRGRGVFSALILTSYLIPGVMLVVPLFQILAWLQLINSLGALMVAYPTFTLPFATWLLMGAYRAIPDELEEAALIDGCNRAQAFFRVILPLVRPALLAVALAAVTSAFNEFLLAFMFVTSERNFTLSVGLAGMVIGDVVLYGPLAAGAIMMMAPVVVLYGLLQRFMVAGLTAGSVKG